MMTVREAAELAGCTRWIVYHALGEEIEVISWHPYQLSRVSVLRWIERRKL